jgi:hypothetical protein
MLICNLLTENFEMFKLVTGNLLLKRVNNNGHSEVREFMLIVINLKN